MTYDPQYYSREALTQALRDAEATVAADGWGQPWIMGSMEWKDGLLLASLPTPDTIQDPGDFLARLSERMLVDPKGPASMLRCSPGLFGIFVMIEGWAAPPAMSREELERYRSTPHLSTIPGALPCRNISAIDLAGEVYQFRRIKGENLVDITELPGYRRMTGRIPRALRDILLAVARTLPKEEADLAVPKLEALDLTLSSEAWP